MLLGAILLTVLVLGFFGFIPGISSLIGPKVDTLGTAPTPADIASAHKKAPIEFGEITNAPTPKESIRFSGSLPVSASFTANEITARLQSDPWRYNFLTTSSVRFNEDGTVEMAGTIDLEKLIGFAEVNGLSNADAQMAKEKIQQALTYVRTNPPYHIQGTVSGSNNSINIDITKASIGRFSVPEEYIRDLAEPASFFATSWVKNPSHNTFVRSLSVVEGQLKFDGTVPAKIDLEK